ncbi:MAG: hypothetical protein DWI02_05450 [Planctomycetota bacterium]|nr:MAG: hypothetical protein DWI02_05450 [Planctomycetota bacterium]
MEFLWQEKILLSRCDSRGGNHSSFPADLDGDCRDLLFVMVMGDQAPLDRFLLFAPPNSVFVPAAFRRIGVV